MRVAAVFMVVLAELVFVSGAATLFVHGRLDLGTGFWLYTGGVLVALALAVAVALPPRWGGRLVTHGALVCGALLFVFPFVWLVGTSFKYTEEQGAQPPRWVPTVPPAVRHSPYVTAELCEPVEPPRALAPGRWPALRLRLEEALWERGRSLLGPLLVAELDTLATREALFTGLWENLAPSLPESTWAGSDESITAALLDKLAAERLDDVWLSVFRGVALRRPSLTDTDRQEQVLPPAAATEGDLGWQPGNRAVRLRTQVGSLTSETRPVCFVHYDLESSPEAVVTGEFPLPLASERLLSVTIPLRQDRSWHDLRVVLEVGGECYANRQPLYLGSYRWGELTLKLAERDHTDERRLGVWFLDRVPGAALAPLAPDRFRLTLRIGRTPRFVAGWRKYTQSYRNAWYADEHWPRYLVNSLLLVVLNVVGQVLSCSLVAYAFARLRWPGRDALFLVLLGTMMLPGQVTMIPVFLIMKHLGWYNTLRPLWVPAFLSSAFFVFMLRQFMRGIPLTLEEAARIDGCSFFGTYWRIILPLQKPALAAVGIFTFMGTWNEFMGALIFVNDQRLYPLALGLFNFRAQYGGDFGMMMAASTLMILPVVALFFLCQRYFIEGVTLTGMQN
jgi:ABC-type glycerol-3-phosphate transport system permease component